MQKLLTPVVLVTLSLLSLLSLSPTHADTGNPPRELVFLTWSEYMDPELVAEFEAKFDAKVRFVYFESDETRTDMLIETDGQGFDLIMVNEYALPTYQARGWLAKLDLERIPNHRYINPRWQKAAAAQGIGIPYFWGTVGIAYRADLVDAPITRWADFFQPPPALQGKIVMIKNMTDVLGMALKAQGYSVNSIDPKELQQAGELLQAQKPYVHTYSYISLGAESALVTGEAVAAMVYSGDALMVGEHHPEIRYVVPEEGSSIWVDFFTIAASSKQAALAADFINFMNEPEIAARQAEYVYYATPNQAAEKFLPEEYFANPVIYPSRETLEKCEFYTQYPPRALRMRNLIFNRLLN